MSVNKNALLRYQVLDRCFRNPGRKYFWQDLLDEINKALVEYNGPESKIKRRQLFDDIIFMESDQGFAIPLKRQKEGRKVYYKYTDSSFSISNQPLNEEEKNQIVAAISVLSRFSGAPQFESVQEMIPVLQDRLGLKGTPKEVISLQSNIDLKGLHYFATLYEAIVKEQVLDVHYRDFKSESPFPITFHPYYLKQYNNRWFVFGLNEELDIPTWNLALDRIQNISHTRNQYLSCEIDWEDYFFDIIGVTKKPGEEIQEVVLEFSRVSAPYVKTKPLHPTQKIEEIDGKLIVRIKVIPNYELESQILSYGENVEVLEPADLKRRIETKLSESLSNYQSNQIRE